MNTSPDYDQYAATVAAHATIEAELRPLNKTAFFDALAGASLHTVVVTFDGGGDEGQIETVEAFRHGDVLTALPKHNIDRRSAMFGNPTVHIKQVSVQEAVEAFVFDLLEETYGGWENNDGAFGELTFDVGARTIELDFNQRYTASNNYQRTF